MSLWLEEEDDTPREAEYDGIDLVKKVRISPVSFVTLLDNRHRYFQQDLDRLH